jgi:hypothetical protein
MAWSKTTKGWGAKKKPRKKGSRTNMRSKAPRRKATRRRYLRGLRGKKRKAAAPRRRWRRR